MYLPPLVALQVETTLLLTFNLLVVRSVSGKELPRLLLVTGLGHVHRHTHVQVLLYTMEQKW